MIMNRSTITCTAFFFLLFINYSFSQTWKWQHPVPEGHNLLDIFFWDTDTGWASGAFGTIIHTNDGGQTWVIQETPTEDDIVRLFFVDEQKGWAFTWGQEVLYTEDEGENWTFLYTADAFWGDFHFINPEIGFIVGAVTEPELAGIILRTEDGGLSWNQQANFPDRALVSLSFTDSLHGWATGQNGLIVYTDNGGLNWQEQESGTDIDLLQVSFVDTQNGWATGYRYLSPGYESIVLHTIDGGVTWTTQTVFPGIASTWLRFKDEDTGFLVAFFYENADFVSVLYRTLNGGVTWDRYDFGRTQEVFRGFLKGDQDFWLIGNNSRIMHSEDDGLSWNDQIEILTTSVLKEVQFVDLNEGWATGYDASILHTVNGGESWQPIFPGGENRHWGSLSFINDQNGWLAGDKVFHTLNGGQDWEESEIPVDMFVDKIFFPDSLHGWIIGQTQVLSTENGGQDWDIHTFPPYNYEDIYFVDSQRGWIIDDRHTIWNTQDGGDTWSRYNTGLSNDLRSVYFTDRLNGWVLASGSGAFYRTQNGGETWEAKTIPEASYMLDVYFIDPDQGWVVGGEGEIWYTEDGGDTWTWQDTHTDLHLFGIYAVDAAHAWAVGFNGAILKYSAESTPVEEVEIAAKPALKIYPNPATDELTLIIPGPTLIYQLTISNEMGQVRQRFQVISPQATIQLKGLPPGVYFLHLTNGTAQYTEKIMVVE